MTQKKEKSVVLSKARDTVQRRQQTVPDVQRESREPRVEGRGNEAYRWIGLKSVDGRLNISRVTTA